MSAMIEIVDGGFANCIQDAGRTGYRDIGVPVGGAADRMLLACANALLGNAPDAAGIEVTLTGPSIRAESGPLRCALAGDLTARVTRADGRMLEVPAWHTATLFPGDTLAVGTSTGPGYVAISGGLRVAPQLGSCSTYPRARLGGIDGRPLASGDRIRCGNAQGDCWLEYRAEPFCHPEGALRVIAGPQDDHFASDALAAFFGEAFEVTREIDRMGIRLAGPPLAHQPERGADIVSDGITPGAIQVPASGQPIVLGPDCQTVGGYAKIATVISADLPRLAHLAPGQSVRFAAVSPAEARAALHAQRAAFAAWRAAITAFRPPGVIDEAALYANNLISGAVNASGFHRADTIDLPGEHP